MSEHYEVEVWSQRWIAERGREWALLQTDSGRPARFDEIATAKAVAFLAEDYSRRARIVRVRDGKREVVSDGE